jgi:hypothetical protein
MDLLPMAQKSFFKALWRRLDVFAIILPTTHQLGSQVLQNAFKAISNFYPFCV